MCFYGSLFHNEKVSHYYDLLSHNNENWLIIMNYCLIIMRHYLIIMHRRIHMGETPYPCMECSIEVPLHGDLEKAAKEALESDLILLCVL